MINVFDKILRPTAREIKATKIISFISAIVDFVLTFSVFSEAADYADSYFYYWSSNARSAVSMYRGFGVFLLILGLVELGLSARIYILEKSGKVCPECERVYLPTEVTCFKCHADLTHAMGVKEYLLANPTASPKKPAVGAPTAAPQKPTAEEPPAADGAPGAEAKKFCSQCGHAISEGVAFCPNCGKKIL